MKSNKIPSAVIHTLRWECPTFDTKNELNKHMEESCPYYKVHCLLIPRLVWYFVMPTNCHSSYRCLELGLSRQEFHEHSMNGVKISPNICKCYSSYYLFLIMLFLTLLAHLISSSSYLLLFVEIRSNFTKANTQVNIFSISLFGLRPTPTKF